MQNQSIQDLLDQINTLVINSSATVSESMDMLLVVNELANLADDLDFENTTLKLKR